MPIPFICLVRELAGTVRTRSRRKHVLSKSHVVPEAFLPLPVPTPGEADEEKQAQEEREEEGVQTPPATLLPELLLDIIKRVEAAETSWPSRKDVVACAAVCRSWREIVTELVRTPEQCGLITFPISLKQPGPRENPIQCFIKRDRSSSTYQLYLGLSPALSSENCKLLLVAKKMRRATCIHFVISFVADDFSRASSNYVGMLRSNFLGTKFTIHDSQPPNESLIPSHNRSIHSRQVSPRLSAGNYLAASISYELSVLRSRGPRRMHCTVHSIPVAALEEGEAAPTPTTSACIKFNSDQPGHLSAPKEQASQSAPAPTAGHTGASDTDTVVEDPLVLKNKAPRWHDQLQCWCLNFKGRVTVASVKNFQLVAAADPCHNLPAAEQENVILQFGKIGKDVFTMDYRYPISAFQAFAICLSSFDTKPVCE